MKKLTSKFVRQNCYFILYDYPNDDKIIYYFDSYDELSRFVNYPLRKLVTLFNSSSTLFENYCLPVKVFRFHSKLYLHLFIDEEQVGQNRETI